MSAPDSLVWGDVPDESQQAAFRGMVAKAIHDAKPPLPRAYKEDLINAIMDRVDDWDWWKRRWYGVWNET